VMRHPGLPSMNAAYKPTYGTQTNGDMETLNAQHHSFDGGVISTRVLPRHIWASGCPSRYTNPKMLGEGVEVAELAGIQQPLEGLDVHASFVYFACRASVSPLPAPHVDIDRVHTT
jgi:hypothetical protein